MKHRTATACIFLAMVTCGAVRAHFHMLFPDSAAPVTPGRDVRFTYRWGHPFEHEIFDASKPTDLIVVSPEGKKETIKDLQESKDKPTIYRFTWKAPSGRDVGDYIFALTAPEVLLEEGLAYKDTVKVVVHVQAQQGWDQTVGLPFELVPLTRPYGLEPGTVFQAQAIFKDKPLAGAMVEIERYNREPFEEGETLPPEEHRTRTVKTDPNGILTCTLHDPGWWCITAYHDGGKTKTPDGKQVPLQLRTTFWVHVDRKQ